MKKVFLLIILATSCNLSFGQKRIFMEILENKKICNKEDQLTYFLQSKSFERRNEDHYYHYYAVNGKFYTTCIINQNECYVIYQTDNAKDYNDIKATITGMCHKEYAADKSDYYVCNEKRVQDVQVNFTGYSQADKVYEIKVYQNPENHEVPYLQADRVAPGADKAPIAKKTKKKPCAKVASSAAAVPAKADGTVVAQPSKNATPAGAQGSKPSPKHTAPMIKSSAPSVNSAAPAIKIAQPKETTVKSVTPSVKK